MSSTRGRKQNGDRAGSNIQKRADGKPSVYATVTARIIEQLEKGTVPWSMPWAGGGLPCNAVTLRPYHGCNVFALGCEAWANGYASRGWLTFNQARESGVMVQKGQRGCPVFWMAKFARKNAATEKGPIQPSDDESRDTFWLAKVFYVFSLDQLRDLDEGSGKLAALRSRCDRQRTDWQPLEQCERVIANTGATIREAAYAAYVPSLDVITMPPRDAFHAGAAGFYPVLMHETVHWSGAPTRLNRDLASGRFGNAEYALEELVAELGAAFLCHRCGIDHVSQSAAYLATWLQALKDRPDAFVKAASEAQKAADFIWPPDASTTEDDALTGAVVVAHAA